MGRAVVEGAACCLELRGWEPRSLPRGSLGQLRPSAATVQRCPSQAEAAVEHAYAGCARPAVRGKCVLPSRRLPTAVITRQIAAELQTSPPSGIIGTYRVGRPREVPECAGPSSAVHEEAPS
jgi:hypothetical protein